MGTLDPLLCRLAIACRGQAPLWTLDSDFWCASENKANLPTSGFGFCEMKRQAIVILSIGQRLCCMAFNQRHHPIYLENKNAKEQIAFAPFVSAWL
jgi:hypothetical protein